MSQLSELEKIALSWAATLEAGPDWWKLYEVTHPVRKSEILTAGVVSAWKRSARIANYFEEQKRNFAARVDAIRQEERERITGATEQETSEAGNNNEIGAKFDFSDRGQLLQYLNRVANTSKDEKRRFEALKLLADLQQFKKDDPNGGEIQRFYTPLACQDCPLYLKQKEKTPPAV